MTKQTVSAQLPAKAYEKQEAISEVCTTMAMEQMPLSEEEISLLKLYQNSPANRRRELRAALLQELSEE